MQILDKQYLYRGKQIEAIEALCWMGVNCHAKSPSTPHLSIQWDPLFFKLNQHPKNKQIKNNLIIAISRVCFVPYPSHILNLVPK